MCGIAGFSITQAAGDAESILTQMLAKLSHRGPESTDILVRPGVAFGRTLLSFSQPLNNPQPLVSRDGRAVLVFNGEIYNQDMLRERLRNTGHDIETDSDLILSLYLTEGLSFLSHLRGMFAIALYDFAKRTLLLARDPFGKKPLVYSLLEKDIAFSSELTSLIQHPRCTRRFDRDVFLRYFVLNVVPSPYTMMVNTFKVPPGSYVLWREGELFECRYWSIPAPSEAQENTFESKEIVFEQKLTDAIQIRLDASDVPLGTFLSGGLDSAVVTAIAARLRPRQIESFSIGFEAASFDESHYARLVADHCKVRHHLLRASNKDLADVAMNYLQRIDEPLADPSFIPYVLLSAFAKRRVKGVLSGDGADEMLLGYRWYEAVPLLALIDKVLPPILRVPIQSLFNFGGARFENMNSIEVLRLLMRGLGQPSGRKWYEATGGFSIRELVAILTFTPSELNSLVYDDLDSYLAGYEAKDEIDKAQMGMIFHYLRDVVLTKVDRGSMLASLEVRCPFLDVDLVSYMMGLPRQFKLQNKSSKVILRCVARKYLVPEVIDRSKQGFRIPVAHLLAHELKDFLHDSVFSKAFIDLDLIKRSHLEVLFRSHFEGTSDRQKSLWSLLCLSTWVNQIRIS